MPQRKESEYISVPSAQDGLAASAQPIGAIDQERWVDETNPAYGPSMHPNDGYRCAQPILRGPKWNEGERMHSNDFGRGQRASLGNVLLGWATPAGYAALMIQGRYVVAGKATVNVVSWFSLWTVIEPP